MPIIIQKAFYHFIESQEPSYKIDKMKPILKIREPSPKHIQLVSGKAVIGTPDHQGPKPFSFSSPLPLSFPSFLPSHSGLEIFEKLQPLNILSLITMCSNVYPEYIFRIYCSNLWLYNIYMSEHFHQTPNSILCRMTSVTTLILPKSFTHS